MRIVRIAQNCVCAIEKHNGQPTIGALMMVLNINIMLLNVALHIETNVRRTEDTVSIFN